MPIRPSGLAVLAAVLLSSCSNIRAPMQVLLQPVQEIRHGDDALASAYYRLGRLYQERGDLEQALANYARAIAREPKAADARIAAAAIHAQQGRLAQARAMLLEVCADYPALDQALNNLGYVYYLEGDYEAAAKAFRMVLARDPGSQRARNNLRLAEGAGAHGAEALAALAPVPPQPALLAAPAAAGPSAAANAAGNGMQLVQLAPNVYELKAVASSTSATTPAPADAGRLEIANGNGDTGLAKRVRTMLASRGIQAGRLTNARPFNEAATRIEFRPGHEAAAQTLHTALGGKVLLRPQAKLASPTDIRLVLGKDAAVALAQLRTPDAALFAAATTSPRPLFTLTQERP